MKKEKLNYDELAEEQAIGTILKHKVASAFINDNQLSPSDVIKSLPLFTSFIYQSEKCANCPGLSSCKQNAKGMQPHLVMNDTFIEIEYADCAKRNEWLAKNPVGNKLYYAFAPNKFPADIYVNDKRKVILSHVKRFLAEYPNNHKGIYLHGPFGSGKSCIMAYLAKQLAEKGHEVVFVYYPEMIRHLKSAIGTPDFEEIIATIKQAEILILDDFGGESPSSFIRDEVLCAILQHRMVAQLATFVTTNLNEKELIEHLQESAKDIDKVKASRIFERMRSLMEFIELKDDNYR